MLSNLFDQSALLALADAAAHGAAAAASAASSVAEPVKHMTLLEEFADNFIHNLFKPLLLFFYAGFLVPMLHVKLEFPKILYQSITIYLLLAIGWHGGEELARLSPDILIQALGFMLIGFLTNCMIGVLAYVLLRSFTRLRRVDAATVSGYYGSDSAGTFVTCVGVLNASMIPFAAYMPVMLAVMEIPGCLIALMIVARLRRTGMDVNGNMADEAGYNSTAVGVVLDRPHQLSHEHGHGEEVRQETVVVREQKYFSATAATVTHTTTSIGGGTEGADGRKLEKAEDFEDDMALQSHGEAGEASIAPSHSTSLLSAELLHEVLLNPGIYLLFAGILIGFVSALQGPKVTKPDDLLFVDLLHPILCLFLLEMGMTASSKLKDLRYAGWQFVAFALIAPNIFATTGMCITHAYSMFLGQPFQVGTYALFAVLCGAASYIALPAVQRMAIPEASPTLPLAASLGCTFSYNVTIGIPIYILIAKVLIQTFPVVQAAGAAAGAH